MLLHVTLFCFVSIRSEKKANVPGDKSKETIFSLFNIAVVNDSPAADISMPPEAPEAKPAGQSVPPEQIVRSEQLVPPGFPADKFIEDNFIASGAVPQAAGTAGAAPAGVANAAPVITRSAAETAVKNSAGTEVYIKSNYNYIQRRIRDKLVYPPQARRAGIEGKTELIFTIYENGKAGGITVRVSSGDERLDRAAVEAVNAASPFPRPPAEARLRLPVVFRLN
jgi:protein TonB